MEVVARRRTALRCALAVLAFAAAYGIAGRLSLWLAIPPGYATALWPPSGLALAGVLIWGPELWPGIWLGSFLVNVWTAFDSTDAAALLASVAIPTSIGVGAVVQALAGASLVRRCIGFPNALTRARHIGAFLVLGGPVSCLISATVGVTALAISGRIPWALYPIQWGTWWVGDALGVLITTPLVLSCLAEPREIWRRRRISVALPLVGSLALAVLIFGYTHAQEQRRLRLLFEGQAEGVAHTIRTRLDDYLEVLHGVSRFYASTPEMSGQALHSFVQRSFARHLGLEVLSCHLRAPDAQRERSAEAAPGEPYPQFQRLEHSAAGPPMRVARCPEALSGAYGEPQAGQEWALGFDLVSTPDALDALQQARDTGQPAATGPLTLGQASGRQFGLLVFLPIYGPGLRHTTVEERRQNLRGYVIGLFRVGDIVKASLQALDRQGIALRIEDEAAPANQRLLYDSRAAARSDSAPDGEGSEEAAGVPWKMAVELAGRRLGLHFTPTLGYLAAWESLQPYAVFGGGLAFTSLLGAFLLIVTGRAIVIEQLMVERTAQLEASTRLQAEAKQRQREAEVLTELGRTINAALDVNVVLQRVANGAKELCRSDGAAIALCEPGTDTAVIRYWAGAPYQGYHGVRVELGRGIGGLVLATGRPFRTEDYARDPRLSKDYLPIVQAGQAVGVLVVPIRIGAHVDGLLYVGTKRPRAFTDHDEAILQRLADHAAIALHNARLYAAAERRRRTAESLAEVGRLLSQSLDFVEVGQRVVDHVQKLLQVRAAALYQLDPASGTLVAIAVRDEFGLAATPWRTLPPGMGAVGLAVCTRQPVVTGNVLTDPRIILPAAVRAGLEPIPVCAVLALPLLHDDLVIGALSVEDECGRVFDEEAKELARLFADQVATALANAQLYAEVQAARERLQGLSRQLLEAQEAERRRIAHELHDEAGQLLTSVHLALEEAVMRLPPRFRGGFDQVRGHLDDIEAQLRRLSHELRPTILDDLGLLPALQLLVDGVTARTGLRICVDSAIEGRMAPHVETALYRILQEGITNVIKHAAATRVQLQLRRDAHMVHALLQDDGVGFAVDQEVTRKGPRGLGLLGIQERAEALGGTLQIISAPGQGTTLRVTLPAEPREAPSEAARAQADASVPASPEPGGTQVGDAA
jgi:signal transduction histidine kinase/integral membrane sensor domain MASE1